jgi:uncharacterized iron-regulated membrane protein
MTIRSLIFWPHLVAGVLAGIVIFIMSVTGVLLMYEKQAIGWADSGVRLEVSAEAARLPVEDLLARVRDARGGAAVTAITIASAPDVPAIATVTRAAWLVDPYSGAVLGESAPRLRRFFRSVTDWHRWLATSAEQRVAGRAITGWANLIFLLIVISGLYLWIPRRWTWRRIKAVAVLNPRLSGKARDFNWHNAIGAWCAVPLFFIVLGALPISFPWANALVYRIVGESPPPAAPPPAARPQPPANAGAVIPQGLNAALTRAEWQVDGWRTISLRVPASGSAPAVFTIDRGTGGQPQLRGTLTIDPSDGQVVRWEPFESLPAGRRLRSIARFLHTGEVLGFAGQTIAGLASLGAAFLVWTGITLAIRRLVNWSRPGEVRRDRLAA